MRWECTKKGQRVYKKKDKRENSEPVCMCACTLLSASGSMKCKEAPSTSPLTGFEKEKEFRRD